MKHYISSEPETLPMFKNKFLDFFSRVHWISPLIVYVPALLWFVFASFFVHHLSFLIVLGFFLSGLFMWTLTEYVVHRFVFHYHPNSRIGKRLLWIMHGVHHDYPSDPMRLVLPLSVSIPTAVFLYFIFYLVLGGVYAPGFMSGFLLGYLFYDMCHYAIHHFPMKSAFWSRIKAYHMRHHFQNPEKGFGVSSVLWDIIFKTTFRSKRNMP